ncbi:hypothetical protein IPM65_03890 [Candidatus Roizmanbacteria bacterium]|nr:MAG: hypothetical protein IPM65_03890 [Candidatus Roizmanbacteria bacterium]
MDRQPSRRVKELVQPGSLRATPLRESRPNWFQRVILRKKETPRPETNPNTEFDRNKFTVETGTMNHEKAQFNPELQAQYSTYLHNHLTRLADLYNRDPNALIFQSPAFRHQKLLLETLATKTDGNQYEISKADIAEALKTDPDLWITTTLIMEEDMAMTLAGLGLVAEIDPDKLGAKSAFDVTVDPQRIYLDIDRGRLNKLTKNHPVLASLAVLGAGALSTPQGIALMKQAYAGAVAAIPHIDQLVQKAGAVIQNPALLAPFAAQYAGLGISALALAVGNRSLFKEGVGINIRRNADLLQRLKSGRYPAEEQYLQDIIGLNISDLRVTRLGMPPGTRTVQHENTNPNSIAMEQIQASLVSQMWTRFKFYNEGLGIPPEKINMISENLTFGQTRSNFRGELTVWGEEMQQVRSRKIAEFINRTAHDPNPEEQMMIDIDARREIITRRLEKRLLKQEASQKTVSMLTTQAEAVQTGESKGRIIQKQTEDLTTADSMITDANTTLATERDQSGLYVTALENLDKTRERVRNEYGVTTVAELQNLVRERDILADDRLEALRDELQQAEKAVENLEATSKNIDRLHTAQEGQFTVLTTIDARLAAAPVPAGGAALAPVNLDANFLATATVEQIFDKINTAHSRLAAEGWPKDQNAAHLKEIYQAIAEARARQIDAGVAVSSPDLVLFTTGAAAVGGAAAIPGAGMENHALMNMTVDQIIAEVNNALPGTLNPNLPADRERVRKVKNEVRRKYDVRYQAWREIESEAGDALTRQNTRSGSERTNIENEIQKLETERDAMRREEADVAAFKDDQKIANSTLDRRAPSYHKGWQQFETYHRYLSGLVPPRTDLDPANLHTKDVDTIMADINAMYAIDPSVGWPPAQNNDPEHIRWIVAAKAESEARNRSTDMTAHAGAMADLLADGVREEDLAIIDMKDVRAYYLTLTGRGVAAGHTEAEFAEAIQQAKRRHALRKQMLGQNITAAKGRGGDFADTDVTFLQLDPEFQKAYRALEQRKARLSTPAAPVVSSADLDARITARTADRDALQEFPNLTEYLKNITQNTYKEYIEAATKLDMKRAEVASKATGAQTSAELQRKIEVRAQHSKEDIEQAVTDLKTAEAAVEKSSPTVKNALEIRESAMKAYRDFRTFDRQLRRGGAVAVGLSMTDLIDTDYDELMTRINTAYDRSVAAAITPPLGWPKEENKLEGNQKKLTEAIAGARLSRAETALRRTSPNAVEILGNLSLEEALSMNDADLAAASLAWRVAAGVAAPAAMTAVEVRDARKVLKDIIGAQKTALQESIDANSKRQQKIAGEIEKIEERYQSSEAFIGAVKDMVQKQEALFTRIPDLIGAAADAQFTVPVRAGNRNYTDKEINPSANGVALGPLPKGYFDILQMMTGYQDNAAEGRDVVFQKLINVSQFQPTAIALELNRHLDFGLGAGGPITIDRVLTEIQRQVNNKTLSQSDIFHAVRSMRENYISHVRAIS